MPAPIIGVWSWTDGPAVAVTASWVTPLVRDSLRNTQMFLVGGLMIFRKVLGTLALLVLAPLIAEGQTKTTITGNIQDVTGIAATSGTVEFKIKPSSSSILYFVSGVGVVAPQVANCGIDGSGDIKNLALTGACQVWGNDLISPGNTTYDVSFLPNGTRTNRIRSLLISGSTYNLANPTFAPNVKLSPQRVTVRAGRVEANLVPAADGVFNLGANDKRYANAYLDSLFITNDLTFTDLNVTGVVGSNLIPDATGRDLGSTSARWDAFLETVTIGILNNVREVDGNKFTTIQAAITDACASGAPVYVPAGTYTLTTGLTACDNLRLYGAGAGSTIIQAGANIDLLNDDGTQMDNIEIAGFTFDGQKGTWTGAAIRFDQGTATNVFIHDSEFLDIARAGINIVGANNTDIVIHGNKFNNIGTDQNDTAPGNAPIFLDGVTRGTITGNTINSTPWAGIRVASFNATNGITIIGNAIQNSSYGIAATGILFTNLVISGNSIEESTAANPKNGIDAGGVVGFSITGNTVTATTNNFGSGINTDGASNGSVVGNIVTGAFSSGIQVGANTFTATSDVVVTANIVEGHTRGITDFGTTGTVTRLSVYGNIARANTTDYLLTFATGFQGVAIGPLPASAGPGLRMSNGGTISYRNNADDADIQAIVVASDDLVRIGNDVDSAGVRIHHGTTDVLRTTSTGAAVTSGSSFTVAVTNPLEGELSNAPRWIMKVVDHTDMVAAATADDFVLWTLPANTEIRDVYATVVTAWEAVVGLSAAVCSVGTAAGPANGLTLDDDFFATGTRYELHDATATGGKGSQLFDTTDKFAPFMLLAGGDIEIQCDLTGDDHADTNAGQARIYILVSQPLGNTTVEAN
ncbi:hypothetical protein LCGC14_0794520 [marine sediment metagenome]|uniref:Rhamnogalacturonase A/B/Epimerase-like pectate lyase domain-containing protein n=1 Tax=marine sediment metagenome TaxID=412755 RepID=A0A0F9SBK4_9ZZZZ